MARLPSLFVSHGAPTFALEPGMVGPKLAALGQALPRPEAILVVSAHWMTPHPHVGVTAQPETIHDFRGFPAPLYELRYPVAGHPALAQRALDLLTQAGWDPRPDARRGLDHGAWVPLLHLAPAADIPTFQVSLPARLEGPGAWDFGAALAPLADEGVLIVGSGSLTHNLADIRWQAEEAPAYAAEFAAWVRAAIESGDAERLRHTLQQAPHAQRAHPTTEHFLPLLVAAGAAGSLSPVTVIEGGMSLGVLAMDAFLFGGKKLS